VDYPGELRAKIPAVAVHMRTEGVVHTINNGRGGGLRAGLAGAEMKTWILIFYLIDPSGVDIVEAWSYPSLKVCKAYEEIIATLDTSKLVSRCKRVDVNPEQSEVGDE